MLPQRILVLLKVGLRKGFTKKRFPILIIKFEYRIQQRLRGLCSPFAYHSLYCANGGNCDLKKIFFRDVATICTRMAASFGAVLLVAGTKGKRTALKHARVMIHQPHGGAEGQTSDIEITAREFVKLKKELNEIIAGHCGQPIKKVEKDSDRDYWMTADEAKEYGIIDDVLQKNPKKNLETPQ